MKTKVINQERKNTEEEKRVKKKMGGERRNAMRDVSTVGKPEARKQSSHHIEARQEMHMLKTSQRGQSIMVSSIHPLRCEVRVEHVVLQSFYPENVMIVMI